MRVVRNVGYIKSRQRTARLVAWLGGLALVFSLFLTFMTPNLLLPAYAVLILGFIGFQFGMQQVTKWSRKPSADQLLDDALRRLNDRFTLIHFSEAVPGHPEHVLVGPSGLIVITTRDVFGQVIVKDNKFRRVGGRLWFLAGMGSPQLGNPPAESERERQALQSFLRANDLPGADEIEGVITFLPNPRRPLQLDIESSDITVVRLDDLFAAIRELSGETILTKQQRDQIVEALSQGEGIEGPLTLPTGPARAKRVRAT